MVVFHKTIMNLYFMTLKVILEQKTKDFQTKVYTFSEVYDSRFVNFELPTGVFEVLDNTITLREFVKKNSITFDISMKRTLKN